MALTECRSMQPAIDRRPQKNSVVDLTSLPSHCGARGSLPHGLTLVQKCLSARSIIGSRVMCWSYLRLVDSICFLVEQPITQFRTILFPYPQQMARLTWAS